MRYIKYVANEGGVDQKRSQLMGNEGSSSETEYMDIREMTMSEFKKHLKSEDSVENKSELEKYLMESCEKDIHRFDVLEWWKVNSCKYCVLSLVACTCNSHVYNDLRVCI